MTAPRLAPLATLALTSCFIDWSDYYEDSACDTGTGPDTVSARLELVVGGLVAPTDLQTVPWDPGHLYVLDQPGQVYKINPYGATVTLGTPWADVSGTIGTLGAFYDERGLLGMAATGATREDGYVYLYYTAPTSSTLPKGWDHQNIVGEFPVLRSGALNAHMGRMIWTEDHPYLNHNGGSLAFGADGYLYVSLGDGGNANDVGIGHPEPLGNGQDRTTQLGSILRLQVGPSEATYSIPADNPYQDGFSAPEIYAYGFRNPSGIAFDPDSGELYVADAGQSMMEEVDQVEIGKNYGWNTKEGTLCFNEEDELSPFPTCADTDSYGVALTDPILEYTNAASPDAATETGPIGSVTVGGAVYHGHSVAGLEDGDYVFGSFTDGPAFGDPADVSTQGQLLVGRNTSTGWQLIPIDLGGGMGHYLRHVSADQNGNIYVLVSDMLGPDGTTGAVYKLVSAP